MSEVDNVNNIKLIKYNKDIAIKPFGLNNLGFTCYFNALLQSILSCTSLIELLMGNINRYNSNKVTKLLIELIQNVNNSQLNVQHYSIKIWKAVMESISNNSFKNGQQDSSECLHYFLDSIDEFKEIQRLFLHRYINKIFCFDCSKWVSKKESMCNIFEVQPDLKTEQLSKFKNVDKKINMRISDTSNGLSDFLYKQVGYIDKDFECPNCKIRSEKYNIINLTMAPEILIVLSKKYNSKSKLNTFTEFTQFIEFNGTNGALKYEAVSQIEHSGGMNGGHYWCVSKRNDGWYYLNDSSYVKKEFSVTNNTYIVFYHIV